MYQLSSAFLAPSPLFLPKHGLRQTCVCTKRQASTLWRRTLCVAQEEKTHASPPSNIPKNNSQDDNSSIQSSSIPDKRERARKARLEAERLELMAAKAKLESERAEIQAERKKLELDKVKNMKEIEESRKGVNSTLQPENPYEKPSLDSPSSDSPSSTSPTSDKKTILPPSFTATSLSDFLSAEFPRVSEKDITIIKEKLCGVNTFFVTEVDRSPFDERVVFRGNLRRNADVLLEELEELAKAEGISERVRLFFLYDPKDDEEGSDKRPVLVALPAAAVPNQTNTFSAIFSLVLGLAACVTTFSYGIGIFGLTPEIISQIAKGSVEDALLTLPVSVGAITLALIHDAGHRVAAAARGVKLGLPFFIPSLQIGTYGTITPLESYPRLRKDLFDVAVSGPLVGLISSIGALIAGLVITSGGEIADWFPQIPSSLFHASVLVGSLADIILPAAIRENATIAVHPLTVIGYTGLLVNALNLMPIGRLDGGRIVQALYGRAVAGRASAVTLIIQGFASLFGNSPLLLFWGLVCVFLQRESDYPCQNEVIEPDNTRTAIGLGALCMMLLILIPFPDQIGDILGRY